MEPNELLELYKATVAEQRSCADDHFKRVAWFISILSAVGAAVITGLFRASSKDDYSLLISGPIIMIFICEIAIAAVERIYRRFLLCITSRAKLEYRLGMMDDPRHDEVAVSSHCLGSEPLVPLEHRDAFANCTSTKSWVDEHMKMGWQKWAHWLFRAFECLSLALLVGIIDKAIRG